MDINGASAIVTGGASGIGAASARALAAKGVKVVVADMNAEKGEEIAKEIDGVFVSVDVTDSEQIKAAIAKAEEIGTFRILVNSAGIGWAQRTIGKDGNFDSAHNLDFFKKVINVNVFGTFDFVRLGATAISRTEPLADGERGAIVNTASISGVAADYGFAAYAAVPLPAMEDRPLLIKVKGSAEESVPLDYTALPETLLMPKENAAALTAQLDLPQELEAPVQLGQTVGTVRILSGETQLGEYEVRAAADAEKMDFGTAFGLLWDALTGCES